ncbi:bifunctional oligoribonuclease/PAP phosphatase NrnA [Chloroflexota bacterium]
MTLDPPDAKRIQDLILHAQRIQVVSHVAPDGDAIGSLLGLGWLLRAQGKEPSLTCEDPVPDIYRWLPGSEEILPRGRGSYDLVISLDCSDPRRMGDVFEEDAAQGTLINVDHHVTNTQYGSVNWVDPSCVATAQMILTLADLLDWELTQQVAVCLLNGLVTDTRSFRTSNVDTSAMQAAVRLMAAGASLSEVTRRALNQLPVSAVRLWGEAIHRMHLHDDVLWTEVTNAMRQRWSRGDDGTTGLTNFLSSVREAKVVVVFTERDDATVDVGMRAVPGYDVAQVALSLGGGGHPQASGCTLEGDLAEVRERVLAEIGRSLAQQRTDRRSLDLHGSSEG